MFRNNNKKKEPKFEVKYYSGYKGEETPRAVVVGEREFKIEEILERKRVRDQKTGKKYEVFTCKMEGDVVRIEIFESGEWSISFPENS